MDLDDRYGRPLYFDRIDQQRYCEQSMAYCADFSTFGLFDGVKMGEESGISDVLFFVQ